MIYIFKYIYISNDYYSPSSLFKVLDPGFFSLICLAICGIIIAINNCNTVDNIVIL